jgi:Uma2 family endonuclease
MATVAQKLITAEEFMNMPDPEDGSRQELLQGVIITMPPPQGRHGVCCMEVARLISNHVKANKLGFTTCNDAGFISERDPDSVRGPDVAFYGHQRVTEIPNGYFEVSPDLAVEVLSPNDADSRVQEKVRHYLKHGVSMVWLVDPRLQIVTVYRHLKRAQTLKESDTLLGEDVLPGFSCGVAEFFC